MLNLFIALFYVFNKQIFQSISYHALIVCVQIYPQNNVTHISEKENMPFRFLYYISLVSNKI